jgi:hypothetical protein
MKKLLGALAALPLLTGAGLAWAGQPVQLTDKQMDRVTAGFTVNADAMAQSLGAVVLSQTATLTTINVAATGGSDETTIRLYAGQALSQSASQAVTSSLVAIPSSLLSQ